MLFNFSILIHLSMISSLLFVGLSGIISLAPSTRNPFELVSFYFNSFFTFWVNSLFVTFSTANVEFIYLSTLWFASFTIATFVVSLFFLRYSSEASKHFLISECFFSFKYLNLLPKIVSRISSYALSSYISAWVDSLAVYFRADSWVVNDSYFGTFMNPFSLRILHVIPLMFSWVIFGEEQLIARVHASNIALFPRWSALS